MISMEPKTVFIKDKQDFLSNYWKLEEMVFYRIVGDKVHVKVAFPAVEKEVKLILSKIKE